MQPLLPWLRRLESTWGVLASTGNGIGGAPASLRAIPDLDDDDFDELYNGELVDAFWHQGTLYAATPFAVDEVLLVLPKSNAIRQTTLLQWIEICLSSERIGRAKGSKAGLGFRSRRGRG